MKKYLLHLLVSLLLIMVYWPTLNGTPLFDDEFYIFSRFLFIDQSELGHWHYWSHYLWPLFDSLSLELINLFSINYLYWHVTLLIGHFLTGLTLASAFAHWKKNWYWPVLLVHLFHPFQVTTAGWIIQLKTVVCALLAVMALRGWQIFLVNKKKYWLVLAIIFFWLSLMAKSLVLVLPFLALIYYWMCEKENRRFHLLALLPFLLMSLIFVGRMAQNSFLKGNVTRSSKTLEAKLQQAVLAERNDISRQTGGHNQVAIGDKKLTKVKLSISTRLTLISSNLVWYTFAPLIPFWPSPAHDIWGRSPEWWVYVGLLVLILFLLWSWLQQTWHRWAILWLIAGIAPVLGIIFAPFMTYSSIGEQHVYLTLPALTVLVLTFIPDHFSYRMKRAWLILTTITLAAISFKYAYTFNNAFAYYERILQLYPGHAMATLNLSGEYAKMGNYRKAVWMLEQYLQKQPAQNAQGLHSALEETIQTYRKQFTPLEGSKQGE